MLEPMARSRNSLVIVLLLALGGGLFYLTSKDTLLSRSTASGGPGALHSLSEAEQDVKRLRIQRAVLAQREQELRQRLRLLELQIQTGHGDQDDLKKATEQLRSLLVDQKQAEKGLLDSFRQMWEAQERALAVSTSITPGEIAIQWPVPPRYGISSPFMDPDYPYPFDHKGVDFPVEQGSAVMAAADGIVVDVRDNGLGFSSLTVSHLGFVTLYGHTSAFFVKEGDRVRAGQTIAASGGAKGEPGSGDYSTGPHLHFELIQGGRHIDPVPHLPPQALGS